MAWAVHEGELLFVEGCWSEEERSSMIIAEKELLASTFGLVSLAPLLPPYVLSFTDNTVAQAAMRSMAPRGETPRLQQLAQWRTLWLYEHDVMETAHRVTTTANVWADLGSRGAVDDVICRAVAMGLRPRRVHVPVAWRDTSTLVALDEHSH